MKNEKRTLILEAKRSRVPWSKLPWSPVPKKRKREGKFLLSFSFIFQTSIRLWHPGVCPNMFCKILAKDSLFPHVVTSYLTFCGLLHKLIKKGNL